MISPNTPPGTDVVVIKDSKHLFGPGTVSVFKGQIVTIHIINVDSRFPSGYHALLEGFEPITGYDLSLFRYLDPAATPSYYETANAKPSKTPVSVTN